MIVGLGNKLHSISGESTSTRCSNVDTSFVWYPLCEFVDLMSLKSEDVRVRVRVMRWNILHTTTAWVAAP